MVRTIGELQMLNDLDLMVKLFDNKLNEYHTDSLVEFHKTVEDKVLDTETKQALMQLSTEDLANLMRIAENAHIDEMNDRETQWDTVAEHAKSSIAQFALNNLSVEELQEWTDICNAMAC